jgi:hypothetical protein
MTIPDRSKAPQGNTFVDMSLSVKRDDRLFYKIAGILRGKEKRRTGTAT